MKHPLSGQVILPGQSYAEPEAVAHEELEEQADPGLIIQTVADPEATKKARAAAKLNKTGDT